MTTLLPFASDYMEGTYPAILDPAILEKLTAMNFTAQSGYGTDKISTSAKDKIRQACHCPYWRNKMWRPHRRSRRHPSKGTDSSLLYNHQTTRRLAG